LSQAALPAPIEDCRREIDHLDIEIATLDRESAFGSDHRIRLAEIKEKKEQVQTRLTDLEKRWEKEKELVSKFHELRGKLDKHQAALQADIASPEKSQSDKPQTAKGKREKKPVDAKDRLSPDQERNCRAELAGIEKELIALQGEEPLVLPVVAGQAVAEVV